MGMSCVLFLVDLAGVVCAVVLRILGLVVSVCAITKLRGWLAFTHQTLHTARDSFLFCAFLQTGSVLHSRWRHLGCEPFMAPYKTAESMAAKLRCIMDRCCM